VAAGVAAVPGARYLTLCLALAAAVAVATRIVADTAVLVGGTVLMGAGMALLAVVVRLARGRDPILQSALRWPALALAWGVVAVAIVALALALTTTFWGAPKPWRDVITGRAGGSTATDTVDRPTALPPCYLLYKNTACAIRKECGHAI